ncbi:hypothetical protein SPRG_17684, partial [Saprolegnia parasitica CBS 223.65]
SNEEDDASEPEAEDTVVSVPIAASPKASSEINSRRIIAAYVQQVVKQIESGESYNTARLMRELRLLELDDLDLEDAVNAVAATLEAMPSIISADDNDGGSVYRRRSKPAPPSPTLKAT